MSLARPRGLYTAEGRAHKPHGHKRRSATVAAPAIAAGESVHRASRTRTWVLAPTAVASFMVALDALVVSTALSTIRRDFGTTIEALEWTINAYNLSFAVLLLTGAALGDRFGRRRVFVIGLAAFTAASIACARAPSMNWLIAARALQGQAARW
jgi:predicted MFS family arabinose efflux permease